MAEEQKRKVVSRFMDAKAAMDEFKLEIKDRRKALRDDLKKCEDDLVAYMNDVGIDKVVTESGQTVFRRVTLSVAKKSRKRSRTD